MKPLLEQLTTNHERISTAADVVIADYRRLQRLNADLVMALQFYYHDDLQSQAMGIIESAIERPAAAALGKTLTDINNDLESLCANSPLGTTG